MVVGGFGSSERLNRAWVCYCRMEDLEHEVTVSPLPTLEEAATAGQSLDAGNRAGPAMAMLFGTPSGRMAGGYRASLVARVHLRLGMWRWSISEASKARTLSLHGQNLY